jgi:hypothetical protein
MARVFNSSKTMNHFFCPLWAAFHKATPFQGITQSEIKNKNNMY